MRDRLSRLLADKEKKEDKWSKIQPQLTSEFRRLEKKKTPATSTVDKPKETRSGSTTKPRLIKKS
jgi:hypothetical protein